MPTRWSEFQGVHISALVGKIQENTNKCTALKYIVFTIKALEFEMFRPFVSHPWGVYINVCIEMGYK